MKLETKRLILRKPKERDVNDLIEGLNNLKVSKNISTVPHPYRKKDATWWINHCNEKKKKKESYNFEIELKEEKKLVGAC
jgi:[ribosomal protein S5]-alanine N-acetyltransferase